MKNIFGCLTWRGGKLFAVLSGREPKQLSAFEADLIRRD